MTLRSAGCSFRVFLLCCDQRKNQHEKEHKYGQLCYRHGEAHAARIKDIEHELYISSAHPMNKSHYLSFAACCTDDRFELVRFYPEGNAEARFSDAATVFFTGTATATGCFLSDFNFFRRNRSVFFRNRSGVWIILQYFKISLIFQKRILTNYA